MGYVVEGSLPLEVAAEEQICSNACMTSETSLWRAVITQALMDAGSNSAKMELRKEKARAIAWLSGVSEEFDLVCHLANLPPHYVRKKAKEAMARGCKWRVHHKPKRSVPSSSAMEEAQEEVAVSATVVTHPAFMRASSR